MYVLLNVVYTDAFHILAQVLVAMNFLPVDFVRIKIDFFMVLATFLKPQTLTIKL